MAAPAGTPGVAGLSTGQTSPATTNSAWARSLASQRPRRPCASRPEPRRSRSSSFASPSTTPPGASRPPGVSGREHTRQQAAQRVPPLRDPFERRPPAPRPRRDGASTRLWLRTEGAPDLTRHLASDVSCCSGPAIGRGARRTARPAGSMRCQGRRGSRARRGRATRGWCFAASRARSSRRRGRPIRRGRRRR